MLDIQDFVEKRSGPPQALISCINYLNTLFTNLPESLPLNPATSSYNFGYDMAEAKEEGPYYALNHGLELVFATHELRGKTLLLTEHGSCLVNLIALMKDAVKKLSDSKCDMFKDVWVERLINAAKLSGATMPSK
jgi:hypothetical protein